MIRSVVRGFGAALPKRVVTNSELEKIVETTDEWIVQRTGITQRYIAAPEETSVSAGCRCRPCGSENAGPDTRGYRCDHRRHLDAGQHVPCNRCEHPEPSGHDARLCLRHAGRVHGSVYAVTTADSFIRSGQARRVLVIGTETFSRILDWNDRTTCVLFGDGAGAIVLEAQEGEGTVADRGVLATSLRSDGSHKEKLYVDGGPSTTGTVGHLRMEGREVFGHAVGMITDVIIDAFDKTGLIDDLDWLVPHQANRRIIEGSAKKLAIPLEKVVITVDLHGNTSAASIPLVLLVEQRIKKGDLVMLEAMGGGFTWGAVLLRW